MAREASNHDDGGATRRDDRADAAQQAHAVDRARAMKTRRRLLRAWWAWPLLTAGAAGSAAARGPVSDQALAQRLRAGGVVLAMRHALAPGTFDPPQFRLGDCRTQRNLSDEGRAQARRIGAWFAERSLAPRRVRSSPWCRCLDTATLAFGRAEPWAALGSPRGADETTNEASLRALRAGVAQAAAQPGFEVWVTHMFVLSPLAGGEPTASGEALLLHDEGGGLRVLGRLAVR